LQFGNGLGDRATKHGEVIHFGLEARSQQNAKALTALAFWSSFGVIWPTTRKGPLEHP